MTHEVRMLVLNGLVALLVVQVFILGAAWVWFAARLRRRAARLGIRLPNWPEDGMPFMLTGATGFVPALDLDAATHLLARDAPQLLEEVRRLRRMNRALAAAMLAVPVAALLGYALLR